MMTVQTLKEWAESHIDVCLDLVRIYIGIGLVIKSIGFIGDKEYVMNLIAASGDVWFGPALVVHYVILAHLAGGLMLVVGIGTRIAALVQIPVLLGAVFYVNLPRFGMPEFRQNFEFSALVLILLCMFAVFGAGRWSVDHYVFKRAAVDPRHA